jgi:hypothetical protein
MDRNKFPFLRIEFHAAIFAWFFGNSILPRMTNKDFKFLFTVFICMAITGKDRPRFLI